MEVESPFYRATDELDDFVTHFDATADPGAAGDEWHDSPDSPPRQRLKLGLQRDQSAVIVDSLRSQEPEDRAERLRLLYDNLDVRWLQLVAGHSKQSLVDLLDDQKLQDWQRELQAERARQQRAKQPFLELQQRQRLTREQLERLDRDQLARQKLQRESEELVESARLLIETPGSGLWSLATARHKIRVAAADSTLDGDTRHAQLVKTAQSRGDDSAMGDFDLRRGMARYALHKYALSHTSQRLLGDTMARARETLENEWPLLQDAVESTQALGPAPVMPEGPGELWQGTQTVDLAAASRYFTDDGMRKMAEWASVEAYGSHNGNKQYSELLLRFTTDATQSVTQTFLQAQHPSAVSQVIARAVVLPERKDFSVREIEQIRVALRAHLVWFYLEHRSLQEMAREAVGDKGQAIDAALRAWSQSLDQLLTQLRDAMALYLSWLARQALMEAMRPLVRLPQALVLQLQRRASPLSWQVLNNALSRWDPKRLIVDDAFKRYFETGQNPYVDTVPTDDELKVPLLAWQELPAWQRREYAALALHGVFSAYFQLLAHQQRYDTERRLELQRSLDDLELAMAQGNVTATPALPQALEPRRGAEYTGVLLLKPYVKAATEQAYGFIQQYCKGLKGLPYDEYQAEHAFKSGLADAHARLVALLVAETQLIFPTQYKTQHQQDFTIRKCTDALNALKRYRFGRHDSGYTSRVDYQDTRARHSAPSLSFTLGL